MSNSTLRGLITGVLELGAALGALIAGPCADRFSRKVSSLLRDIRSHDSSLPVHHLGILRDLHTRSCTASRCHERRGLYLWCAYDQVCDRGAYKSAGRTIAGLGVGALSMLIPMYNAELAPPGIRGSLVALQQLAITFGILIAYWIGYGTNCEQCDSDSSLRAVIGGTTVPGQSSAAWRIPLALQIAPAIVLCVGSLFLPFSPRWLMLKGQSSYLVDH